jgi:hypothetical protein
VSALALDPVYGDLMFTGGTLTLLATNSVAECAQELNARFGMGKGEWFLDLNQGTPWMQAVLGVKNPDKATVSQVWRAVILLTPGVKAILALPISFVASTRTLTVGRIQIQHDSNAIITGGAGKPFIVQNNQVVAVQ